MPPRSAWPHDYRFYTSTRTDILYPPRLRSIYRTSISCRIRRYGRLSYAGVTYCRLLIYKLDQVYILTAGIEETDLSSEFLGKRGEVVLDAVVYPEMRGELFDPFVGSIVRQHRQDNLFVDLTQVLYLGTWSAQALRCDEAISQTQPLIATFILGQTYEVQYLQHLFPPRNRDIQSSCLFPQNSQIHLQKPFLFLRLQRLIEVERHALVKLLSLKLFILLLILDATR